MRIKPILEKSLTHNNGTASSKSFGKIGRLELSNSYLDVSSDHSFASHSKGKERARNKSQYRSEPQGINYSIEFLKKYNSNDPSIVNKMSPRTGLKTSDSKYNLIFE
jgi:hypothetical protein